MGEKIKGYISLTCINFILNNEGKKVEIFIGDSSSLPHHPYSLRSLLASMVGPQLIACTLYSSYSHQQTNLEHVGISGGVASICLTNKLLQQSPAKLSWFLMMEQAIRFKNAWTKLRGRSAPVTYTMHRFRVNVSMYSRLGTRLVEELLSN